MTLQPPLQGHCTLWKLGMRKHRVLAPDSRGAHQRNCNREQSILTPCWICLTLTLAIHCLCQQNLPLCLNVKLKWLFFSSWGDNLILTICEWLQKRKSNTFPPILLNKWSFNFTSSPSLLLCSIKQISIQTPIRWSFEALVCHLLSLPIFQTMSLFLTIHLVCKIYWPIMKWADWAWTQEHGYTWFSLRDITYQKQSPVETLLQILLLEINTR